MSNPAEGDPGFAAYMRAELEAIARQHLVEARFSEDNRDVTLSAWHLAVLLGAAARRPELIHWAAQRKP